MGEKPSVADLLTMLKDLNSETVEIRVNQAGTALWVTVDGVCILRCSDIKNLTIFDARKRKK